MSGNAADSTQARAAWGIPPGSYPISRRADQIELRDVPQPLEERLRVDLIRVKAAAVIVRAAPRERRRIGRRIEECNDAVRIDVHAILDRAVDRESVQGAAQGQRAHVPMERMKGTVDRRRGDAGLVERGRETVPARGVEASAVEASACDALDDRLHMEVRRACDREPGR